MSGNNLWTNDCLVPNASHAHGLSFSPAAAVFNGRIYVFHQGQKNNTQIWFTTFDGANWSEDKSLQAGTYYGIKNSPAITVFNNKLYIAYHDVSDHLRVGTMDSSNFWDNMRNEGTFGISYSPAIAVFNNHLYVAYQGSGANAGKLMYISSGDGVNWTSEKSISTAGGEVHVTGAPALVTYRGKLYCFHKGTNETFKTDVIEEIAWQTAEIVLECGPEPAALVALGAGALAIAGAAIGEGVKIQTSRQSDWTWITSFDGNQWSSDMLCPTAADAYGVNSESPAAVVYRDRLFCVRQGRDNSNLWCGEFNGTNWLQDQHIGVSGNTFCTTGAPALVEYNGSLYCFHQGKDDSGWMWMTSITAPPAQVYTTPAPAPTPNTSANSILISCDNAYELYLNGALLGKGSDWTIMGNYPMKLNPGTNLVAVKGIDVGGIAALIAEIRAGVWLSPSNSSWKVSLNAPSGWEKVGFDDSRWANATDYGAYGTGPWQQNIANFPKDSPARWIWSGNNDADNEVYMRLTFYNTPFKVNETSSIATGNAPHSFLARVKVNALPANRAWIMLMGNPTTGAHHWLLQKDGTTQFGAWGGNGQLVPKLPLQKWVHIAMTFDGITLKCYVDDVLYGSCNARFDLQGIPLELGKAQNGENDFNGFVKEVGIYNRALTADEVRGLASAH